MDLTLEQVVDMPYLFSRKKTAADIQFTLDELKNRSLAMAQKKSDAQHDLKISNKEALLYVQLADSVETSTSLLMEKFKSVPCMSTPASTEYQESLHNFCNLNSHIYKLITDARHAEQSIQNISGNLPKSDSRIVQDLKMLEFINDLK